VIDPEDSSFRMNTRVSAANLMAAAKELSMEWQETKNYWRDAKTARIRGALPRAPARLHLARDPRDGGSGRHFEKGEARL
jgi:hypothetical protein